VKQPLTIRQFCISLTALAIALFACACTGDSDRSGANSDEQHISLAYRMIDENKTDEAMVILQSTLDDGRVREPEQTEKLRAALASAHVKRAGLTADRFYRFARSWMADDSDGGVFSFFAHPESKSDSDKKSSAIEIFQNEGLATLALILQIKNRFDTLPMVDDAGAEELRQALDILQPLPAPSKGVALYRVLIRIVRFKHRLVGGVFDQAKLKNAECQVDVSGFFKPLIEIAGETTTITSDLASAFPKSAESLMQAKGEIQKALKSLQTLQASAQVDSGKTSFELGEVLRLVHTQLGWNWTCP
jgi:hypothetical protein